MHTGLGGETFTAGDDTVAQAGGDLGRRAVVGVEEDERVRGEAEAIESGDEAAEVGVQVFNHVAVVLGVVFEAITFRPIFAAGRRIEGAVSEGHGVVGEEGPVAIALHETEKEVSKEIGAVLTLGVGDEFAVFVQGGVGVAGAFFFGVFVVPEEIFVEAAIGGEFTGAAVLGAGGVIRVELPLARDGGAIAGALHHVSEGAFLGIHDAEGFPVAEIELAGHELEASGGAEGLGEGVSEAEARLGEAVEVGSPVGGAAVAVEAFEAEVVGHDEEDIGALAGLGSGGGGGSGGAEKSAAGERAHGSRSYRRPGR